MVILILYGPTNGQNQVVLCHTASHHPVSSNPALWVYFYRIYPSQALLNANQAPTVSDPHLYRVLSPYPANHLYHVHNPALCICYPAAVLCPSGPNFSLGEVTDLSPCHTCRDASVPTLFGTTQHMNLLV